MWLCCRLVLAPTAKSDATHRVLMKSYKQICQRPLVCAVFLLPRCLVFFFASGSEARANPERRQSEGRVEAHRENESEIGHFPTVFECKDSAD